MDFFAFIWLMSLTVLLPLGIIKLSMDHKRAKMEIERRASSSPDSLTTSELRDLIREAVEEASLPLRERIERLEDQHGASPPTPLLDAALEDEPLEDRPSETTPAARRRVT